MPRKIPSNPIMIGDLRAEVARQNPELDMSADCATWATFLAIKKSGIDIGYPDIAKEIIELKKLKRSDYPIYNRYPESWFETHGTCPDELTQIILETHLGKPFVKLPIMGRNTLGAVASYFRRIPISLVGISKHITFIRKGWVYDSWNSTREYTEYAMVPKKDRSKVLSILRKIGEYYPISLAEHPRELSKSERSIVKELQNESDQNQLYQKILWILTRFHGVISGSHLIDLIKLDLVEFPDFRWDSEMLEMITQIIWRLEADEVINIGYDGTPNYQLCQTPSTITILRNLNFD